MMKLLDVPASSQTLVFSKTSLQFAKITPQRPRALYYNDDVYLGVVQYGEVVEISAVDPELAVARATGTPPRGWWWRPLALAALAVANACLPLRPQARRGPPAPPPPPRMRDNPAFEDDAAPLLSQDR